MTTTAALAGRRAVVTAGAGGMGRTIATTLADAGATVFVCDVDRETLAALPDGVSGATVDVADAAAVEDWLRPIVSDGVDILVNNAGIAGPTGPIEEIDPVEWRRCLAIDLDGMFHTTRVVAPVMKTARAGTIVNITSTAGIMGLPNRSPYVAAKFGVVGLTKTLAMELGRHNIRVNGIAPGSVVGDRMDRVIAAHAEADNIEPARVEAMYTLGVSMATFVEPQEIADLILYLSSESGRHISGQIIGVDGHTETLYPRDLG